MAKGSLVSKLEGFVATVKGPLAKWMAANPKHMNELNDVVGAWNSGKLPQFSSPAALLRAMTSFNDAFLSIDRGQFALYCRKRAQNG